MPLNQRIEGNVAILSNFARLMNDPRYVDAARDVRDLLDQGAGCFVLELTGVREVSPPLLGLLVTITREIRHRGAEAVLAHASRGVETHLIEMKLDEYWDIFATVDEAKAFFDRPGGRTAGPAAPHPE